MASPRYEFRTWRPGDEQGVLENWNRVYTAVGSEPRTRAEVDWMLHGNPAGSRMWVALHAEADGTQRIVGQYGGWPMATDAGGSQVGFVHCVDSAVDAEHRAGLKRPGLFVELAEHFFDAHGGVDKDVLHYGLPNDRAWPVGSRRLGYELLRPLELHLWTVEPGSPELPAGVEPLERFDEQALWLYHRIAGGFHWATQRDASFLNWRFCDHPRHAYTRLGVRDAEGILRGACILRTLDYEGVRACAIADWICPHEESEVGEALLAAARAEARRGGAAVLVGFWPEWSPWFETLQRAGALVVPSAWFLAVRSFSKRVDAMRLRDAWWFQLADTDLV
jgi:hypothetical protein